MRATEDSESTERNLLTHSVIGAAIEVHRLPGPGLLESIYEDVLWYKCGKRHSNYESWSQSQNSD